MDKNYNSGYSNSGYSNSGNYNSGDNNSGKYNSGRRNSGRRNSGYSNSGDYNSGNYNSGNYNSGYSNSGNYNSGSWNSGYSNSGNYNSGNYNSGSLNTSTPDRFRVFDQWISKEDFYSIVYPNFFRLELTYWITHDTATEKEKSDYKKEIETSGGFLKTLNYKESWKASWDKASEEDRSKLYKIPGYKRELFLEISGIDAGYGPQEEVVPDDDAKMIKALIDKGYIVKKESK